MSEIEKIEQYIQRTKMDKALTHRYQMKFAETSSLYHETARDPFHAVILAFEYGQAKGYRAARAEARK